MDRTRNPHVTNDYAPLEDLIFKALRRFGDMHPGTVDGDVNLMMVEFANDIIDEVNAHPYRDDADPISYYDALQDRRAIPDNVIVNGLLYHYAFQQASAKAELYRARYYRTLNQTLYIDKYGSGRPELQIYDKENTT